MSKRQAVAQGLKGAALVYAGAVAYIVGLEIVHDALVRWGRPFARSGR